MQIFHGIRQLEKESQDTHWQSCGIRHARHCFQLFPLLLFYEVQKVFGGSWAFELTEDTFFHTKKKIFFWYALSFLIQWKITDKLLEALL